MRNDCGVVDEDVDPAEALIDLGHQGARLVFVGDVGRDSHCLSSHLAELPEGLLKPRLVDVGDGDLGLRLGERVGDVAADAFRAASDDDRLVLQHTAPPCGACGNGGNVCAESRAVKRRHCSSNALKAAEALDSNAMKRT